MHEFIEENLIKLGYKTFQNRFSKSQHPESYIKSYQKRIDDDIGKKYFLTLHEHYDEFNKKYNGNRSNFRTDCQFYIVKNQDKEDTFNVDYFLYNNPEYEQTYIEEMEEFYENLWNKLGCRYYEKWSES